VPDELDGVGGSAGHGGEGKREQVVPGAIAAGLSDALFWWSLLASLAIAFAVTAPVNRWLIARGRGHAVMHELHGH
jgi:hypothetical protein